MNWEFWREELREATWFEVSSLLAIMILWPEFIWGPYVLALWLLDIVDRFQ